MSKQIEQDNTLWQFSLDLYSRPEVAARCLALQDDQRDDVNCLMLCCWCGREGIDLRTGILDDLLGSAAWQQWCEQCISPLREIRRALKDHPFKAALSLREQVKTLELEAEKFAQDFLLETVLRLSTDRIQGNVDLLVANLQAYRAFGDRPPFPATELLPFLRGTFPKRPERELMLAAEVPRQG